MNPETDPPERPQQTPDILLELCQDSLLITDADGMLEEANQQARSLWALPPQAGRGRHLSELLPRPSAILLENVLQDILSSPEKWIEVDQPEIHLRHRLCLMPSSAPKKPSVCIVSRSTRRSDHAPQPSALDVPSRQILEQSNEGAWILDHRLRTTFVNQRMADLLGRSPHEMVGREMDAYLFPEDLAEHRRQMSARRRRKHSIFERRFCHSQGSTVWCIVSASPILDPGKVFRGVLILCTDIGAHKRLEEDLQRHRALLADTERLTHMGGWNWDVVQKNMTWTDETYRIHGFAVNEPPNGSQELIARSIACYDPQARLRIRELFLRCANTGEPYSLECLFTRADGQQRWIHTSGHAVWDQGSVARVWGTIQDITPQRLAEQHLQEANRELKAERDRIKRILDTAEIFIVALDPQGCIRMISRYGLELLGYREEEVIGLNWFEHVLPQPEGIQKVLPVFQAIMQGDMAQTATNENEVVTADGHRRLIAWRNTFLQAEDGTPSGTLSAGLDITEYKELEYRRQQVLKAESLRRMAGAVAHHFNNQLHAVMGNIEMALLDLHQGETVAQTLRDALGAAGKACGLSSSMLMYLGQISPRHERIDLCELCRQALPLQGASWPETVQLATNLPQPGPLVMADGEQIRHVLSVLIQNSLEALPQGRGTVHVSVRLWSQREMASERHAPDCPPPHQSFCAGLSVRDNGSGIPPISQEQLFDPFYSTRQTGRGLGLSIALGIAQAHGGTLLVHSTPGSGSTLTLILPLTGSGDGVTVP